MSRRKAFHKITAMLLSAIMVVGMTPVPASADTGMRSDGSSGEIIAFEALKSEIAEQSVPLGISEADLELPDSLTATIRLAASTEEPVLDSGEADTKPVNADTVSGSAIDVDETEESEIGDSEGDEIASPSDMEITKDSFEAEPTEKTVDSVTEITVPLPVTWDSSPEYNGEVAGTYIFTPELPKEFTLASSVEVPAIAVTVRAAAITGAVTAFDALPDDLRWQNTTAPEFPETVSGTVEGETVQILVTWDTDQYYDKESPQRGLYVFTAALGEGYALADGVEPPRITVYIPQTEGRMGRMAGSGTSGSPLEITTAAQLAEIATLVNARENGLELFLFNNAGASVRLKLMNDIDLSAYSKSEGWMPIGTSEFPFTGIFDGNDKSILGLYINRNVDYQGLFGYVGNEGAVKSLGVINVNITGRIDVGSVAGWVRGTVQDCYSTGSVTGSSYVGGVAGEVDGGTLENCYNTGSVTGTGSGTSGSVGGVAGWVAGTVQNCYNTGNVTGTGTGVSIGGIAGWVTNTGIIQNCFNTGSITASGTDTGNKICAGGVAGWVYGTVQNCYSTGSVTGTGTSAYVGGVAGTVSGTVKSCAALNSSISAVGYKVGVGRVAGADMRNLLSGNTAYSGMTVNGVIVSSTDTDSINGMNVDASAIQTLWTTGALSDWDSSIWTLAEGKLPGFGAAIDMPGHIVDGSDLNFRGAGTSGNPYQIITPAQLAKLAELVNAGNASYNAAHYKLMNELDLSGYASGEGWVPIGTFSNQFTGTFDGDGNKITNLTIDCGTGENQGLFGYIGSGGAVKNLGLTGISINGGQMVGGIAGSMETATLQNCYTTGNITALGSVGGVVASVDHSSTVEYCYSTCEINSTDTSSDKGAGGVVGYLASSTVSNCYSTGNISQTGTGQKGYAGGVVGKVVLGKVQDCYSTGNISGGEIAGGVAGNVYSGLGSGGYVTVENCYSTGVVSESSKAGGVAGQVHRGTVKNCAALNPSVSSSGFVGRVLTLPMQGILSGNLAFDGVEVLIHTSAQPITSDANGVDGLSKTAAQISTAEFWTTASGFTANWDTDVWHIESGKLPLLKNMDGQHAYMPEHLLPAGASLFEGAGTSGSPYLIKTADDLAKLAGLVNTGTLPYAVPGRYYRLEKDIDLSAYASGDGWTPIGTTTAPFSGSFDGNNKTITGLTINRPAADYIGLFGYLYVDSKVLNIRIIGANIKGKSRVGGVAGYAWGATVENCAVIGNVSGVESVGGTVGRASSGTVQDCYSSGSVTGSGDYVGGIIGYLEYAATIVQRCYSDSSVSGADSVGGVAGIVGAAAVQNCYSTGNVTGGRFVGGVAGEVSSGSVQNCYSTGSVRGTEHISGVLGFLGGGTAKNSLALNPSINAGAYNYGRMVGNNTSGTLLNNYAFSRMPGTWANKGLSAKDGADVTSQTLFGGSFWTTADNWDTAAWDSGVWTFADGKLPILTGLAGQNGVGGLYLTARDIQYATVGATDGLTYNGSEQIPTLTITFDGETLAKNTDYTASITSTDGSGTSAGTNVGTVTLTITGIGSFYGTRNITYTIGKKSVTITPNSGQSKKYGAADPILVFENDGSLDLGAFTGALNRVVGEGVGTYAISLGTLSAGGNYALSLASGTVYFTIEQAKVASISTIMANVSRTAYEMRTATTAQAVVDAVGLPSDVSVITDGGTAMLPITWSTATAYNVKSAIYAVTGTLTGNINIDPNGVIANLTVTVAPVTAVNPTFSDTLVVTNSDSSATAAELGSAILPASGSIAVEDESIAYTINWNGGETLDRTAVDTERTFTGTVSYIASPAWLTLPGDLSVSRKVTVTAKQPVTIGGITAANKTYDGAVYAPSGTVTVAGGSVPVNQLEWLYESTDGAGYSNSTAPTNAGAYKLTISVPESNPNYAGSEIFNFTIAKREITLVADNKTVIKGGSLPELTYTVGNLAPGKTKADALNAEPVLACPTFDGNTPGSYAITLTGGTATDNYTITTRTVGALTVAEQTYTVTFNLNGGSRTGGGELSQTIAEGGAATAPIVTRNGYTFTGWDKAFTNVASNLAVTAGWSYNGGGGGGGGSSTVPSAPSVPEKKPDQPVTATAPITAAGQNGTASAPIPDKAITDAIAKAQAEAKEQGKTANGIAVALNVTMPKGTTSLAATLTRNSLNSLVSAGVTEFEISGAPVSLSLDLNALKEIQKQSSGDISITIAPAAGLSKEAKALLGNRPVYSITISYVDKNGKTQTITSLGSGLATLSIPYTPGKNEAVGYLFGVYVDAKGKAQRIPGSAYDANSGSLLITTGHFSVYGVGYTAPSAKFTDIGTHWGKEAIDYVVGRGLLSGTSKTTFAPDAAMTRGMLVTALGRLASVDVKAYPTNSFTDVKMDSVFRPYIEWVYKKGIVQGIGNQQFAPDRAITREEIAAIFANYAKATGYKLPVTREATAYADASGIGSTYKTAVTAMQQAGIMMGGTGNKFNPKASATCAEVSSMLHRYIKLTIDPATALGWAKNDAGQYLYYKDDKALTGTQTIDGAKYFFETNGTLKTGWVKDGDNWRYYSGNKALTGWWDIGSDAAKKTYYFNTDGLMVSGKWLEIDGKWYYFYTDGALAKSTKVDGYEVDKNGVRRSK